MVSWRSDIPKMRRFHEDSSICFGSRRVPWHVSHTGYTSTIYDYRYRGSSKHHLPHRRAVLRCELDGKAAHRGYHHRVDGHSEPDRCRGESRYGQCACDWISPHCARCGLFECDLCKLQCYCHREIHHDRHDCRYPRREILSLSPRGPVSPGPQLALKSTSGVDPVSWTHPLWGEGVHDERPVSPRSSAFSIIKTLEPQQLEGPLTNRARRGSSRRHVGAET